MVAKLVQQLVACSSVGQIIVTYNVPEELELPADPRILVKTNSIPKGFGANHNTAFSSSIYPWFIALNPDVSIQGDPFKKMLHDAEVSRGAIFAPCARDVTGAQEDNWRRFPSLGSLIFKAFGGPDGRYTPRAMESSPMPVEWVSGFCMMIRQDAFVALNGFDERYFMYYEDVDICVRAWHSGLPVYACPNAEMTHNARRASRRNFQHLRWHLTSLFRYLVTHSGRLPNIEDL